MTPMSKTLAFWKYALELTEEEFARLDAEGLAVMAAVLSPREKKELQQWLRGRTCALGRSAWAKH